MTMHISGIASGVDTESIINQQMQAERMTTVDPQYQKKQTLEWKQEGYREINTKLLALRTSAFDMKLQGTFMTRAASSSDEDKVKATADTSAVAGTSTIFVHELASGVTKASSAELSSNEKKTTLADQFDGIADTIKFTLEGYADRKNVSQDFSFDTSSSNINDVVREINTVGLGLTASYDAGIDRFFLTTSATGSEVKIDIKADENGFLKDNLKLYADDIPAEGLNLGKGQDARIDFNGVKDLTFSSNEFTLTGINFNIQAEGEAKISIVNDTDAVMAKITAFVDVYNNAMELTGSKLSEKRDRDFLPLTDEQKKEMSEDEIKKWEEKARSGLLKSDSLLSTIYNKSRTAAMSQVEGLSEGKQYTSLSAIGINTANYWEHGKLHIDEDKLREALTDDPEGVMELFTKTGDTEASKGIAQRLYDDTDDNIELITEKAGSASYVVDNSFIGKEITSVNDRIKELEDRLVGIESRYWKQYTAMEKALDKMNSQSAWLMQQMGVNTGQ